MKKIDILYIGLIFIVMNWLSMYGGYMTLNEYLQEMIILKPSTIGTLGGNVFWTFLIFYFLIYRRRKNNG